MVVRHVREVVETVLSWPTVGAGQMESVPLRGLTCYFPFHGTVVIKSFPLQYSFHDTSFW